MAWCAAAADGAETLELVVDVLLKGFGPPSWFLESLAVYIPMGEQEGDDEGAVRSPGETRPIGLKNCDYKRARHREAS